MKLVVCDPENIPPWLFPEVLSEYPDPGISVAIPTLSEGDFGALWKAVDEKASDEPSLIYEDSGCDVGFSHDAPDAVFRLRQELVFALNAIPPHERWRYAERWGELRHGQRLNKQDQIVFKKLFSVICEHAAHAIQYDHAMVLIEPVESP